MAISFSELKKGDSLLQHVRTVGSFHCYTTNSYKSPWYGIQYREVVIEKASNTSYWVEGEKYRKSDNGWHLTSRKFILPVAEDGTPIPLMSDEEALRIQTLYKQIDEASSPSAHIQFNLLRELLHKIPDLAEAAEIAREISDTNKQMHALEEKLVALATKYSR